MSQRNAYVTGGTGFIGINLIKKLLDQGWNVTTLHRKSSDISRLVKLPVNLVEGSITDKKSISKNFPEKIDAVFHLAGDTNLWSKKNETQTAINVDGTENMLRVSSENHAGSFIYTSSASAWGTLENCTITEDLPQNGHSSWVNYERTKWEAEQAVRNFEQNQMKVVILNPTAVTGPFDINNWGKLFIGIKEKTLPVIPNGIISVTHVDEVAKAHISAVDHGINGANYILSGEDCRFETFISKIASAIDVDHRPIKAPDFILKYVAYVQKAVSHITKKEPKITPELVKIMTRKQVSYSSQKAKEQLGYKIIPLEKSINDCCRWLKSEGYL